MNQIDIPSTPDDLLNCVFVLLQKVDADIQGFKIEINDRFTKIDNRFAEIDNRFVTMSAEMDRRFTSLETKIDKLEARMDKLEARMDKLEIRMDVLETKIDKLEIRMDKLETRMSGVEDRLSIVEMRLAPTNKLDLIYGEIKDLQEGFKEMTFGMRELARRQNYDQHKQLELDAYLAKLGERMEHLESKKN